MQTKRFQLDLTEQEHREMEGLMSQAGLKTKREFVSNALTLFRWAAMELQSGRTIGSTDGTGRIVKQLEMPALSAFAAAWDRLNRRMPSPAELDALTSAPDIPMGEALADLSRKLEELKNATGHADASRTRTTA